MRIIRFIDEQGQTHHGTDERDGTAALLTGDLLGGFEVSSERREVRKLLAPIEPRAILCIGLNYRKHAEETGAKIPEHPVVFMKNPAAVNNPDDPITLHPICCNVPQVDWEAELAVVIGKAARDVSREIALDHVLGYTCGNDVSARWWQKTGGGGQFVRGKSFDGFCPLGPALVTPEDIPDPQSLRLTCHVNGELMQDESTADMLFPVADLISQLSQGMTLLPGTVILTGTPSGVGVARDPQVFLRPGDTVAITVENIGTLSNPVIAG